jgi:type IV pilus assembly protein PilW
MKNRITNLRNTKGGQQGFTLVELMVAVVLGLILIGGVFNVLLTNKATFQSSEQVSRLQENSRFAFDIMARNIREAGANSCGTRLVANVVRLDSTSTTIPWWADWGTGTLQGVDRDDTTAIVTTGTADGERVSGTDAILVMQATPGAQTIESHDTGAFEIKLQSLGTGSDKLENSDIAVACDLTGSAIFQIFAASPGPKTIDHRFDSTGKNCSGELGYPTPATCNTATPKEFLSSGLVSKLDSAFWYAGYNNDGVKSLYRKKFKVDNSTGNISVVTEEMFTGVEDLKIEYLTKNISTGAMGVNWVRANDATFSAGNKGWTADNINQVVAVRIKMLLQSTEKVDNTYIQRNLIHVVGLRGRETLFIPTP